MYAIECAKIRIGSGNGSVNDGSILQKWDNTATTVRLVNKTYYSLCCY